MYLAAEDVGAARPRRDQDLVDEHTHAEYILRRVRRHRSNHVFQSHVSRRPCTLAPFLAEY